MGKEVVPKHVGEQMMEVESLASSTNRIGCLATHDVIQEAINILLYSLFLFHFPIFINKNSLVQPMLYYYECETRHDLRRPFS